jgi:hypothetical protein
MLPATTYLSCSGGYQVFGFPRRRQHSAVRASTVRHAVILVVAAVACLAGCSCSGTTATPTPTAVVCTSSGGRVICPVPTHPPVPTTTTTAPTPTPVPTTTTTAPTPTPVPTTTTTAPTPTPVPTPTAAPSPAVLVGPDDGCYPDPEGNCYKVNEFCPGSLYGKTVLGASGDLTCNDDNGWRWVAS